MVRSSSSKKTSPSRKRGKAHSKTPTVAQTKKKHRKQPSKPISPAPVVPNTTDGFYFELLGDVYDINAGHTGFAPNGQKLYFVHTADPGYFFLPAGADGTSITSSVGQVTSDSRIVSLDRDLTSLGAFTANNYRDVKKNTVLGNFWAEMYQVADMTATYRLQDGTSPTRSVKSLPCHYCGLFIPFRAVTVDHYVPQKGKTFFSEIRMLNSLGLIAARGDGKIGKKRGNTTNYLDHTRAGNAGAPAAVTVPTRATRVQVNSPLLNAKGSRFLKGRNHALTDEGRVFISLKKKHGVYDRFKVQAMNGIPNLVPACAGCNTKLGNRF